MKTLLIVDDEDLARQMLEMVLNEHFSIIGASNGVEALEMAIDYRPDLILMDVAMPEMDGITATQRLKEIEVTRDIPIVFMSSMARPKDIKRGYEAGAVDYITKPFSNLFGLPKRLKQSLKG